MTETRVQGAHRFFLGATPAGYRLYESLGFTTRVLARVWASGETTRASVRAHIDQVCCAGQVLGARHPSKLIGRDQEQLPDSQPGRAQVRRAAYEPARHRLTASRLRARLRATRQGSRGAALVTYAE
jgi:hypothetical protein